MPQTTTPPKSRNEEPHAVYSRLVRDPSISHGAFRLWHLLRDYRNSLSGLAWPSQKTIAQAMHCDVHSLKRWTQELLTAGYVSIERKGQNHNFVYRVHMRPVANESRDAGFPIVAMRKPTSPRDAGLPIVTEPNEPNLRTERRVDVKGLVEGLTAKVSVRIASSPKVEEVRQVMERSFAGAGQFANAFHTAMTKCGWRDRKWQPIRDWKKVATRYASAAECRKRGIVPKKSKESLS